MIELCCVYLSVRCIWLHVFIISRMRFKVKLLDRSRRAIWSLSDYNLTRTYNHLVHKRTLNHLAKLTSFNWRRHKMGCWQLLSDFVSFDNICLAFLKKDPFLSSDLRTVSGFFKEVFKFWNFKASSFFGLHHFYPYIQYELLENHCKSLLVY